MLIVLVGLFPSIEKHSRWFICGGMWTYSSDGFYPLWSFLHFYEADFCRISLFSAPPIRVSNFTFLIRNEKWIDGMTYGWFAWRCVEGRQRILFTIFAVIPLTFISLSSFHLHWSHCSFSPFAEDSHSSFLELVITYLNSLLKVFFLNNF